MLPLTATPQTPHLLNNTSCGLTNLIILTVLPKQIKHFMKGIKKLVRNLRVSTLVKFTEWCVHSHGVKISGNVPQPHACHLAMKIMGVRRVWVTVVIA